MVSLFIIEFQLDRDIMNSEKLNLTVNSHSTISLLLLTKPMVGVFHAK